MPEILVGEAPATLMQRLKRLPSICYAIAALVVFVVLFSIGNSAFFSSYNFVNIAMSAVILIAVGTGQTWPIITGGIDLSVGGTMSLVSVVFVTTVGALGYWSYPLCLVIGILIGFVNGNLLSRVKIPSFIATLGTGGIIVSLSYIISPQALNVPMNQLRILDVVNGSWLGFPNIFVIGFLYFLLFFCIQRFTVIGRNIFYVGSNVGMSWLSGVNIINVKNMAFVFSGFGAATAGLILASRQYSGYPTIGAVYVLSSIATVVLGGTAMTGGAGGILNTLIGALLMGVLQNGMTVVGVDVYAQQSLLGAMIILCVWISFDRTKVEIVK